MKNSFFALLTSLSIVSILSSQAVLAQEATENDNNDEPKSTFEKIVGNTSLSGQAGLLYSFGDFNDDGYSNFFNSDYNELGLGFYVNYRITDYLTIGTGVLSGKLIDRQDDVSPVTGNPAAVGFGRGIEYRTDIFEFTLPKININLTRLIFKDKSALFNRLSIGAVLSHGLVFYESKIYAQENTDLPIVFNKKRGRTGSTTEAITSVGGTLDYAVSSKLDIGIESTIRRVNNDKMDAWIAGDANDFYSFTAIGLTYHLAKRENIRKKFDLEKRNRLAKDSDAEKDSIKLAAEEVEEEEMVDMNIDSSETVFGKYVYKNLPMDNEGIVVLDKNGNPIDTIYTDQYGSFQYEKLNSDQQVSFIPLRMEEKDGNQIDLFLENEAGERTEEFDFSTADEEIVEKTDAPKKVEVKEEKKEVKDEKKEEKPELKLSDDEGYYVSVAAFRKMPNSQRMAEILKDKGENPEIIRNLQDTWNLITISKHSTKEAALEAMEKARENGYPRAWVHVKIR